MSKTNYALAAEIDRQFKLHLDNQRFEKLVSFLDGYQDSQAKAHELMRSSIAVITDIVK